MKRLLGVFTTAVVIVAVSTPATPREASKAPAALLSETSFCCSPPPQCPTCDPLPFSAQK